MFGDARNRSDENAIGGGRTSANPDSRSSWDVPDWLDQLASWIWRLALVGAAGWAFLRVFGMLRLVTVPILFALILTALFWPLRQRLVSWRLPEVLASWTVLVLAIGALVGISWLAVVGVGEQLRDDANWGETRVEVENWLIDGPLGLTEAEVDRYEQHVQDGITNGATSFGASRARTATEVLGSVALTIVLVFLFIKDGPMLWSLVAHRFRPDRRDPIEAAGGAAFRALTGYAKGVALTGLVDAVLIALVLLLLGVPLAIQLALLTFFATFLPIIGATAVGLLSVVVTVVSLGLREAVIVAVATLVIQQIEGNVVLPLVMGSQVRLHPAVILVLLATGGAVAGLVGALVAVPLAAMATAGVRGFREAESRSALLPPNPLSPE